MSQVASCSRAALNGFTRSWRTSLSSPAALTRSRTASLPRSASNTKRSYSTSKAPSISSTPEPFKSSNNASSLRLAEHLNSVFSPLKFPPELAARILTHSSHRDAAASNNTRLSFIGRRVLNSYLMLFLHSAPSLQASHDFELIAERALNTYILGEHVAPKWELGRVLKWSPVNVDPQVGHVEGDYSRLSPKVSRTVGLYKVQGSAVEAAVGGIYHQFGGNVAHRVFHTRVLPHILLPGTSAGLNDVFHEQVLEICEQMGGLKGALVAENGALSRFDSAQPAGSAAIP
ncbi:ribonuclease-III-like-domain-containing protein [Cristinia sonorae]|uniref:Ribonuclease-III-like-domain-containing protein n=1 Tax=Cristinia sonorae TaxID=1940300 RepID=A0A8K0USP3_9AGAR|nr:ribonuclease-III-like-domain-containing protein [Cristinia sonorae]